MPGTPTSDWVVACEVDALPPGEILLVPETPPIALFNVDGDFYATDDTCTHEVASLSDGYLDGGVVECSFHFAKFCVRTGAAVAYPATEPLGTYPVSVRDGQVLVDIAHRNG